MDLQRIREMEDRLNRCAAATADLDRQLDRMEELREDMIRLFAYYGSEDWYEDREGEIVLLNPLLPGEVLETSDLGERMTVDEIRSAAEAAWIKQIPMAAEITDCALVFYVDERGQTLRPAWSLTGTGYAFDTGSLSPVELVLDALTGEAKRLS